MAVGNESGQHRRHRETITEGILHRRRDMRSDIESDLVKQPQGPHRHAEVEHGLVDFRRIHPRIDHAPRLDEVGHENAIHEEAGRVFHHDGQLPDGTDKGEGAFDGLRRGEFGHDDLDELHAAHRIKEVEPDDAFGMAHSLRRAECGNGQGRGVRRENGLRRGTSREIGKDFLFHLEILDRGLDDKIAAMQRHRRGRRRDKIELSPRFVTAQNTLGDGLVEESRDGLHPGGDALRVEIAQDHRMILRREPLRNARAHHSGTDHGGGMDRCQRTRIDGLVVAETFCMLLQKMDPHEIPRRIGPGETGKGDGLAGKGGPLLTACPATHDFESLEHGGIVSARFPPQATPGEESDDGGAQAVVREMMRGPLGQRFIQQGEGTAPQPFPRNDLVDKAEFPRVSGNEQFPGKDEIESLR